MISQAKTTAQTDNSYNVECFCMQLFFSLVWAPSTTATARCLKQHGQLWRSYIGKRTLCCASVAMSMADGDGISAAKAAQNWRTPWRKCIYYMNNCICTEYISTVRRNVIRWRWYEAFSDRWIIHRSFFPIEINKSEEFKNEWVQIGGWKTYYCLESN